MAGQSSFILRTPFVPLYTRDMDMEDPQLALPPGSIPGVVAVIAGEWLAYTHDGKGVRGYTQNVTLGNLATDPIEFPTMPAHFDPGSTDVQAIRKIPVLHDFGHLEFDTLVYNAADAHVMGDALIVTQVTDPDGIVRCGLALEGGGGGLIVGFVQMLPVDNNNYLRVRLV